MNNEAPDVAPDQTQQQQMAEIDLMLDPSLAESKPVPKKVKAKAKSKQKDDEVTDDDLNTLGDLLDTGGTDAPDTTSASGDNDGIDDDDGTQDNVDEDAEEKARRVALYAEDVAMPGGHETLTVGDLKNEVLEFRQKEQEFVDRENKMMQQYQQLITISDNIPELDQAQVNAINTAQATQRQHQNKLLLGAIPDWSNERTFIADKANMVETLSAYGVSVADLDSVTDHRIIKLAYDYDRLKRRVAKASKTNQEALKGTEERETLRVKKGRKHKKPANTQQKPERDNLGGNLSGQMNEIEALLGEQ